MNLVLKKYRQTILYGIVLAISIFILKWLETRYIFQDEELNTYVGIVALLFTGLGVWLTLKLRNPRIETVIVEKPVPVAHIHQFVPDAAAITRLNLSRRELEVLQLMADGLSNQEIADKLFVSLNTVKTHSAQIFSKMDVKRRTQAVDQAKRLQILQ